MLNHTLRLAVVDDDPEDMKLLRRSLGNIPGLKFTLEEFGDVDGFSEPWEWQNADILFLDYLLDDHTGLEILQRVRGSGNQRPIVIITGLQDAKIAATLLESGADEYIEKLDATPEVLEACIRRALSRIEQHEDAEALHGLSSGPDASGGQQWQTTT